MDRNICGVNRAIMKANSLPININNYTIVQSGKGATYQFDAETNACEAGRTCCGKISAATTHGVPKDAEEKIMKNIPFGQLRTPNF